MNIFRVEAQWAHHRRFSQITLVWPLMMWNKKSPTKCFDVYLGRAFVYLNISGLTTFTFSISLLISLSILSVISYVLIPPPSLVVTAEKNL